MNRQPFVYAALIGGCAWIVTGAGTVVAAALDGTLPPWWLPLTVGGVVALLAGGAIVGPAVVADRKDRRERQQERQQAADSLTVDWSDTSGLPPFITEHLPPIGDDERSPARPKDGAR